MNFWKFDESGDVARVNGQLAVSRAFGDKNLKIHLRSDPDITSADVDTDTDILILASDGLWKVSHSLSLPPPRLYVTKSLAFVNESCISFKFVSYDLSRSCRMKRQSTLQGRQRTPREQPRAWQLRH